MKNLIATIGVLTMTIFTINGKEPLILEGKIQLYPIGHATFVLKDEKHTVVVDPVGLPETFKEFGTANLILITHGHGDHFQLNVVQSICDENTKIVVPQAVYEMLIPSLRKQASILKNGEEVKFQEIQIKAVPAYNISPDKLKYHPKGRDNGYILEWNRVRIYVSGDTENIPEMNEFKDIDVAFLCMNLPYTMSIEQAIEAVKAITPKIVIPYHYRGSDVVKFKKLVSELTQTKVELLNWYP